jgi:hypothetical protein
VLGGSIVRLPTRRSVAHDPIPVVNLLSPWVFEAMATQRVRLRFMLAAGILAALIGAGWAVQQVRIDRADQALWVEQRQTARLGGHTEELAAVRTYVAAVDRQKQLARGAMKKEVYVSRLMSGLERAAGGGVDVDTIAITVTPAVEGAAGAEATADPAEATCPGPDPYSTRAVAGCVTLSGTADSRAAVGELVENLDADPLFVEPFISTTTTAEGAELAFTGSVGVSTRAFTRRYARLDRLLAGGSR